MTSYTAPNNGIFSYASMIAAASTAETVVFLDRFNYVAVTNLGTDPLWVRADGQAATMPTDVSNVVTSVEGSYPVAPGETQLLANGAPLWYQSSRVIPQGSIQVGNGQTYYNSSTNPTGAKSSPSNPGTVTPMESLAGYTTTNNGSNPPTVSYNNPGTVISLISAGSGATQAYTVAAAG